jgi:hypothetical protein
LVLSFLLFLSMTGQKYLPNEPGLKQFGQFGFWGGEAPFFAGGKKTIKLFLPVLGR